MATFELSEAADKDVLNIYVFGARRFGLRQADIYHNSLHEMFQRMAENPEAYMIVEELGKGVRRCIHASHSIYFREVNEGIRVLRIIGQQDIHSV